MKITKQQIEELIENGQEKKIISLINDSEDQFEVDQELFNKLGVIAFNYQDVPKAKIFLIKSLLLNIYNAAELDNLGKIYFTQGFLDEAYIFFSHAKNYTKVVEDSNEINLYLLEIAQKVQIGHLVTKNSNITFMEKLIIELLGNLNNYFYNNSDFDRYTIEESLIRIAHSSIDINTVKEIIEHMGGLSILFDSLEDSSSKEILIKVLSYRILGHTKVMLPLNNSEYWSERNYIKDLIIDDSKIALEFKNWELQFFNLNSIGYPLNIYYLPLGIHATFIRKQYEHSEVKVEKGDYVIDAGGCFGDTALFFSTETGDTGKVFTFEFIESNLNILKKNLYLNEEHSKNIVIVENPVWEFSGKELYYLDNGPGSRLSDRPISNQKTITISIDDFVENNKVDKIDFIKMDIEGAEVDALKGAKGTILKYQPKMAISVYHSIADFANIIAYIQSLDVKYKFYLDHFTTFGEETILYAKPY